MSGAPGRRQTERKPKKLSLPNALPLSAGGVPLAPLVIFGNVFFTASRRERWGTQQVMCRYASTRIGSLAFAITNIVKQPELDGYCSERGHRDAVEQENIESVPLDKRCGLRCAKAN